MAFGEGKGNDVEMGDGNRDNVENGEGNRRTVENGVGKRENVEIGEGKGNDVEIGVGNRDEVRNWKRDEGLYKIWRKEEGFCKNWGKGSGTLQRLVYCLALQLLSAVHQLRTASYRCPRVLGSQAALTEIAKKNVVFLLAVNNRQAKDVVMCEEVHGK